METTFPTIDLTPFTAPSTPHARADVASQLVAACHRFGFVAIANHNLPTDLLDQAFRTTRTLFALPPADKLKALHPAGAVPHRGYSAPGLEKVYAREQARDPAAAVRLISDFKESYEVGSEANTVHRNIWLPEDVLPGFRRFALELFWRLNGLAETILEAFALGLGLTEGERRYVVEEIRSGHNNQLRFLHYPAVPAGMAEREVVARMPAHTDWSLFTMLFQDAVGGLELEDPRDRGVFVKASPMGYALVLNIGDMFERLTNGYLPSALHRVTLSSPSDVAGTASGSDKEVETPSRYSIPYFFAPDDDKIIRTLGSYIKDGEKSTYEDVKFEDYADLRAKHSYITE